MDEISKLKEAIKIAEEGLDWILHPKHNEPDDYTRLACAQFRANEALEKMKNILEDNGPS